jgi:hypothetical protein
VATAEHLFAGAGAGASPAGADPLHLAGPVGADDAPGLFCCGLRGVDSTCTPSDT